MPPEFRSHQVLALFSDSVHLSVIDLCVRWEQFSKISIFARSSRTRTSKHARAHGRKIKGSTLVKYIDQDTQSPHSQ